jgi:allantoinase
VRRILDIVGGSLLIQSSRILTPEGIVSGAVLVRDGIVQNVFDQDDKQLENELCPDSIDVGDRWILPGIIDGHVHVNEPGRTEWEGAETATRAAAAGGITTIVDMPLNSSPVTVSLEALREKQQAVAEKCRVDFGFHGGAVGPSRGASNSVSTPKAIRELIDAGIVGLKVFQCDSGLDEFPAITRRELDWLMPILAEAGVPLWSHAELIPKDWKSPNPIDEYSAWPEARSKEFERRAIEELIELGEKHSCPIHIVHLATASALSKIRAAKRRGVKLTVETCPHYLYFASEHIPPRDPRFKCCPPIRELENRHLLWQALELGEIDTIGSDHSPCPPSMKFLDTGDFAKAWGGISSLQLLLPILWNTARNYEMPITRLIECMAQTPAKLIGIEDRKGSIAPGKDADLVVFDDEEIWTARGEELEHRHKVTPYEGIELTGRVKQTYLRGELIYDNGKFADKPSGKFVKRST